MRRMLAVVGIALDRRVGLDTVLDSPQPRADGGGERNVGIDVRGRNPILDALAGWAAADDAERSAGFFVAGFFKGFCFADTVLRGGMAREW